MAASAQVADARKAEVLEQGIDPFAIAGTGVGEVRVDADAVDEIGGPARLHRGPNGGGGQHGAAEQGDQGPTRRLHRSPPSIHDMLREM